MMGVPDGSGQVVGQRRCRGAETDATASVAATVACGLAQVALICGLVGVGPDAHSVRAQPPVPAAPHAPAPHTTEVAVGKVVFLAAAMEEATGARAVPEARERILALQTAAGNCIPLLEDVRGRAFRTDERLRQMQVKLWLRRYPGFPLAQILRVVEVAPDGEYEIDYWCDVCAIALFEQKECDCCQGPVVLRRRKLSDVHP